MKLTPERLAELESEPVGSAKGITGLSLEEKCELVRRARLYTLARAECEAMAIDPRERLPRKGEVYKVPNESAAYFVTGTVSGAHSRTVVNIDVRSGVTNERFLAQEVWSLDKWRDWIRDKGRLIGTTRAALDAAEKEGT